MHHLVVKVVNIELQGLQGVRHLLLLLFLLVFIAFDAHSLKFAVSVCRETGDFSCLPSLFVGKNRLQSEPLLIICEFTILAQSVQANHILLLERLEWIILRLFKRFLFIFIAFAFFTFRLIFLLL